MKKILAKIKHKIKKLVKKTSDKEKGYLSWNEFMQQQQEER